jgi:hypothetical protein
MMPHDSTCQRPRRDGRLVACSFGLVGVHIDVSASGVRSIGAGKAMPRHDKLLRASCNFHSHATRFGKGAWHLCDDDNNEAVLLGKAEVLE